MEERIQFLNEWWDKLGNNTTQVYKKGSVISELGREDKHVYTIQKGIVRVKDTSESGKNRSILYLKRGELFPLIWGFDHPPETVYSYDALTEVTVSRGKVSDLKKLLKSDAQFAKKSLEMFVNISWDAMERIRSLQTGSVYDKLLRALSYVASQTCDRVGKSHYKINKAFTQDELSHLMGTSRESVNTQLKEAEKNNIIYKDSRNIILDMSKLDPEHIFNIWFKNK